MSKPPAVNFHSPTLASAASPYLDSSDQEKSRPIRRSPEALYVHIPFCVKKCSYCDFVSGPAAADRRRQYLDDMALEAAFIPRDFEARTVFVGGGTPSMLTPAELMRLGDILRPFIGRHTEELTFEGNPGTLSLERLEAMKAVGATRISMGAQTFDPRGLAVLGRMHGEDDVRRAVSAAKSLSLDVNVDLIYGYPGQDLASLRRDLDTLIGLDVDHASAYCLIYEDGTPLGDAERRGEVDTLDAETQAMFFENVRDRLGEAGFLHYEISNYARSGKECRHNLIYWHNESYHALGVSACSYVDGVRAKRCADLADYAQLLRQGQSPIAETERLSLPEEAAETLMLGLRLMSGVDRGRFRQRTGLDLDAFLGDRLTELVEQGFLVDRGTAIACSRQGVFVSDEIAVQLWPDTPTAIAAP